MRVVVRHARTYKQKQNGCGNDTENQRTNQNRVFQKLNNRRHSRDTKRERRTRRNVCWQPKLRPLASCATRRFLLALKGQLIKTRIQDFFLGRGYPSHQFARSGFNNDQTNDTIQKVVIWRSNISLFQLSIHSQPNYWQGIRTTTKQFVYWQNAIFGSCGGAVTIGSWSRILCSTSLGFALSLVKDKLRYV